MALSGWKYTRNIIINNTNSNEDLFDYQIRIDLNNNNFDFTKAQTNGEDIRFSDDSKGNNLLSLWIENWNSIDGTATIWVKVPYIPANTDTTIYMWYGNSLAKSVSDIQGTSLNGVGDDFDGTMLDTNKWTVTHYGTDFSMNVELDGNSHLHFIHNPYITVSSGHKSAQVGILSNNGNFINNFGIRVKRMFTDPHYVDIAIGEGPVEGDPWHAYLNNGYTWAQQDINNHFIGRSCIGCIIQHVTSHGWGETYAYEISDFVYISNGNLQWYYNDVYEMGINHQTYLTNNKHILLEQGEYVYTNGILGGDSYYDWIFTYKIIQYPPTIIVESEKINVFQKFRNNLFQHNF